MSIDAIQVVERPEPGLARGRWEAPAWAFWVVIAVTVAAAIAWTVRSLRAWPGRSAPR
jgi:hypothetical protein